MRWEYESPERSVIAVDAGSVSVYMPEENKLQIAPLDAGALSPTALGFLLGTAKLRDVFRAEPLAETRPDESGVRLVPRQEAGFEALELWVGAESQQLRESVLHDLFGNRTRIRFREAVENGGVAEEDFRIEVTEDTEVIDLR
jgi:outer membrane lipoprotein-sorting protein